MIILAWSCRLDGWSQGAKIFSCIDEASGYWQVPMHANSRQKTAFQTDNGVYQFKVLSVGLCIYLSVTDTSDIGWFGSFQQCLPG